MHGTGSQGFGRYQGRLGEKRSRVVGGWPRGQVVDGDSTVTKIGRQGKGEKYKRGLGCLRPSKKEARLASKDTKQTSKISQVRHEALNPGGNETITPWISRYVKVCINRRRIRQ